MKIKYGEGDWFAIPLKSGGYAVGLVARVGPKKKVVFGYFFGPRLHRIPHLGSIEHLEPSHAVLVRTFGDLGLICGEWPVIGRTANWSRTRWPMPHFARRDEDEMKAWEVAYSDDDPNLVLSERRATFAEVQGLPEEGLMGAEAVTDTLDDLLK